MAFVGLVTSEHSSGEQRRQGTSTKLGNSHPRQLRRIDLARPPAADSRLPTRPPTAANRRPTSNAPGAASIASTNVGSRRLAAANRSRRSSLPAPASSPASSGQSRPTSRSETPERPPSRSRAADASNHTENPRRLYAAPTADPQP